jgi:hypothetical protein
MRDGANSSAVVNNDTGTRQPIRNNEPIGAPNLSWRRLGALLQWALLAALSGHIDG